MANVAPLAAENVGEASPTELVVTGWVEVGVSAELAVAEEVEVLEAEEAEGVEAERAVGMVAGVAAAASERERLARGPRRDDGSFGPLIVAHVGARRTCECQRPDGSGNVPQRPRKRGHGERPRWRGRGRGGPVGVSDQLGAVTHRDCSGDRATLGSGGGTGGRRAASL